MYKVVLEVITSIFNWMVILSLVVILLDLPRLPIDPLLRFITNLILIFAIVMLSLTRILVVVNMFKRQRKEKENDPN